MISGRPAKILLIDSNVYFAKRLGDALKKEGFDVQSSTQPAFALTTLEYDAPTAIVCATNMREMGALEIAKIIHADQKHATLPIIALGDGSQRALMEAFQAGCEDYIDRQRPPAVIATHIRNIIISKAEGFQPTQMLNQADTSLSGSLSHHDLPGVLQMLGHAHQTGALHINAGTTDAILFFDAGKITHAECGNLFGDEAVIHIIKNCVEGGQGVYKFVYGATSNQNTVLRNSTDLMLDAMREYDESRDTADGESSLLHSLESNSQKVSDSIPETSATSPPECGGSTPPLANKDSAPTAIEPSTSDASDSFPNVAGPASQSDGTGLSSAESVATPTLKRSDILQAELSTYPTSITNRVLDDLRAHGDNPVDRALADLLSQQFGEAQPVAALQQVHSQETPDSEIVDQDSRNESADKELP
jgi:CheY-like chemotaxis protein